MKGTGPRFVTRPVYLRSQFRNNTNTVSTLVPLIHLLQVLCTRYVSAAHHRALQTSGRGWADSKAVHGMECNGGVLALLEVPLSRGCCLKSTVLPVQGGMLTRASKSTTNQRQRTKNPRSCVRVVYIAVDTASSSNGDRSRDCAPVTWAYGIPCPALVVIFSW